MFSNEALLNISKPRKGGKGEVIQYIQIIITDEKYIKHRQSSFLNGVRLMRHTLI